MPAKSPLAATVEDCFSDDGGPVQSTQTAANIAAKRKTPPPSISKKTPSDAATSDSGYSSRTAGTAASADASAAVSKSSSPSQRDTVTAPSGANVHSQDQKTEQRAPKPTKPASRPGSRSRGKPSGRESPCKDPHCKKCAMATYPTPSPLDQPWPINYSSFTLSPHPNAAYAYPPSQHPSHLLHHPHVQPLYAQPVPTIAPPQPRRRISSGTPRPFSYHPGAHPPDGYFALPGNGTFTPGPGGPSPLNPTYALLPTPTMSPNMGRPPPSIYAAPMMSPSPSALPQYPHPPHPLPSPISPHHPRPGLPHRFSEASTRGRPISQYGLPVVSYDNLGHESAPATRASSSRRLPSSHRLTENGEHDRRPIAPPPSGHRYVEYEDANRLAMPPPPGRHSKELVPVRRPSSSSRKPASSSNNAAYGCDECNCSDCSGSSSSYSDRDRGSKSRSSRPRAPRPPMAPSKSDSLAARPSLRSVDKAHGRRTTYTATESRAETERRHSQAEAYQKQTQTESRRPSMPATLPNADLPEPGVALARLSAGSDAHEHGKSRSRAGSSRSGSHTSKSSEPFTIRLDVREGFNMELGGDMVGRSISMGVPGEDGMAELTIGSSKREVRYVKTGSVKNAPRERGLHEEDEEIAPGETRASKGSKSAGRRGSNSNSAA